MLVAHRARTSGLLERGHLVRTGLADVPSARRASCPPLTLFDLLPSGENAGQDARRAGRMPANPVRTGRPRSRKAVACPRPFIPQRFALARV